MIIYIGADHRGFKMKEYLKKELKDSGYEVEDVGNLVYEENDDYPDFAAGVAERVAKNENSKGILICGSGVGVDVAANKFPGIRSSLVVNSDQAFDSRNDDDANVLCLSSNYLEFEEAKKIMKTWINTPFDGGGDYLRRVRKIATIEESILKKFGSSEK